MEENNLEKKGAMWQNISEKGNVYFNMDFDGKKYVVLCNKFKDGETQPDFVIYERKKNG